MEKITSELRDKMKEATKRSGAPCSLFSGGLDTSILSYLRPESFAIHVNLESFGEDIPYAEFLAKQLSLKIYHRNVSVGEAIEAIPQVIKILKSFDPAIPNDLAVYFGLKAAREKGFNEVMTGDGADELFAGYSYMQEMENLEDYIRRLSRVMSFSSNDIGKFFHIKIKQPYIDREIVEFSLSIPINLKIRREKGEVWGKWIIRKAFEKLIPSKIIWQNKRPLECGSGMSKLREIISSRISDGEFEEKKKRYPIRFFNKEHLYYYEIYSREVGNIPTPGSNQKKCPGCGAGMGFNSFHCGVCGHV